MRAGPLSSPEIIEFLKHTLCERLGFCTGKLPRVTDRCQKAQQRVTWQRKLRQHYSDSVDSLTLTPELEVIEHLPSKNLLHPEYRLPRSERIPRYLELLKSSVGMAVAAQKAEENLESTVYPVDLPRLMKKFGKPAPDFFCDRYWWQNPFRSSNTAEKSSYSIFWAVWNGFLHWGYAESEKRFYDTYKDQGFDIIGVSLGPPMKRSCEITFRKMTFRGGRFTLVWNARVPLAQQYDVRSIPARWLIDRDGRLICP